MFVNIFQNFSTNLFFSLGVIIIIATIFAFIARMFKQPLIPAYIFGGFVLGPLGIGLVTDMNLIRVLSEMGIAFLLFIVGLEMKLTNLKSVTVLSVVTGVLQVILTFILGNFVALKFGFGDLEALYIGLIVSFSSTMVVVKLLSDKEKLSTLHGRIILGILLVQDIIVIFILSVLSSVGDLSLFILWQSILKGILLFIIAILISKLVLSSIFNFAAKSQELLFLCSITFCFLFSLFAYLLDYSIAVGAFLGGIALAGLPYDVDIIGRVKPLKDFFATIFFVSLGMELVFFNFSSLFLLLVCLLLIIVVFKPLIVTIITSIFGYGSRISFLSGMHLGQISEFSLILASAGLIYGHISQEIFSLTVLLVVLTIILTSYFIQYDNKIYSSLPFLRIFDKISIGKQNLGNLSKRYGGNIVLFGCHRMGSIFSNTFKKMNKDFLVVDDNPEIINDLVNEKISCLYGDANNLEVLERLNLRKSELVVSTIPDFDINSFLVSYIKNKNKKVRVIVTANHFHQARDLYNLGADYVILPHVLSGEMISHLFKRVIFNNHKLKNLRERHINHLLNLKHFGHDHIFLKNKKRVKNE